MCITLVATITKLYKNSFFYSNNFKQHESSFILVLRWYFVRAIQQETEHRAKVLGLLQQDKLFGQIPEEYAKTFSMFQRNILTVSVLIQSLCKQRKEGNLIFVTTSLLTNSCNTNHEQETNEDLCLVHYRRTFNVTRY